MRTSVMNVLRLLQSLWPMIDRNSNRIPNPALNLAPFSRWTLRDKAAQRRLALRWANPEPH